MYFLFNNESSKDYDIKISKINNLSSPARKMTKVEVPFRGTLTVDEGVYEDHFIEIECTIVTEDITLAARKIKNWLKNGLEQKKLIISNEPDKFYYAIFKNSIDIEVTMKELGKVILIFDCKPGRLLSGEETITIINKNTILFNPSNEIALPYMKISGSGDFSITINDKITTFKGVSNEIEVDSEIMECFLTDVHTGELNPLNSKIFSDFPYLSPGENKITYSDNVSKIEIKPKWIDV